MVENGRYLANPKDGRYLKRKVSAETLGGASP
jgi:hypothetical protein